jgi:RNA polymerase sigma factor (sigma-70 family)
VELCGTLRTPPVEPAAWSEAWLVVSTALLRYLRMHASRLSRVSSEDLEDLASQKSLELVDRAVSGSWDPAGYSAAQAATYLSTMARNGLLDWIARERRFARTDREDERETSSEFPDETTEAAMALAARTDIESPEDSIHRREFTDALCGCVRGLDPRSRHAWILRALFEMTSREIAEHPDVRVQVGHLDVLLYRSRQAVRQCMVKRGHGLDTVPAGAWVELWRRHGAGELDPGGES